MTKKTTIALSVLLGTSSVLMLVFLVFYVTKAVPGCVVDDSLTVTGDINAGDANTDKVKAWQYCDENGNNCFTANDICTLKCPGVCSDVDGNFYGTIAIGTQCWMSENMRTTKNPTGTPITRYCYDNDSSICDTDGGLYTWDVAMNGSTAEGAQGICPAGWHIPTDGEYYILENYLATGACASNRIGNSCDPAGTALKVGGSSGFAGILTGIRTAAGLFQDRGIYTGFWSSTESGVKAWHRELDSMFTTVFRNHTSKALGFSVRCLKD